MMNISRFFTGFSLPQGVNFSSQVTGLWAHGKNRMVSVMTSGPGIVTISLIFITSFVLIQPYAKRYVEFRKEQKMRKFVERVACVWTHRKDSGRDIQFLRKEGFSPPEFDAGRVLNLSCLALTDEHLQYMAQLDVFNDVEYLSLSENPLLTGHGVAAIGKKGFLGLQHLILNKNPRLVETGFKEWVSCKGFNKLKTLDLYSTGITTDLLEEMIRSSDWVKRLEGLDLRGDNKIETLPHNVLDLTTLTNLLFPKATRYTKEAMHLIFEKKAQGGNKTRFFSLGNKYFTEMTFEKLCALCGVPLQEV